jgi:uncharacterized membrane protein YheB (UPF0754 family)
MTIYLIPFVAAFTGWFANWLVIKLLLMPKRRKQLISKMANAQTLEKYMDQFLRVKLPEAMPVFKMFIGDSTIEQVKGVFMKEADHMLPEMIEEFLKNTNIEVRNILWIGTISGFIIGVLELLILLSVHSS